VPRDLVSLSALPGVGRKTAAVVLGNAFGQPAIAADVHVQRIVHRLGWTTREHPADAEVALVRRFAPEYWVRLCHQLIRLGRDCCRRQKPRCERCPVALYDPKDFRTSGLPDFRTVVDSPPCPSSVTIKSA
jgi:endonuclease-3